MVGDTISYALDGAGTKLRPLVVEGGVWVVSGGSIDVQKLIRILA